MTQYNRVYNFSAGPSMLPVEVLENVQKELSKTIRDHGYLYNSYINNGT